VKRANREYVDLREDGDELVYTCLFPRRTLLSVLVLSREIQG
jgi:hypothetical protein